MSEPTKIAILGTGGTIAGVGAAHGGAVGYDAAQLGIDQLLKGVHGVLPKTVSVVMQQLVQMDSKDMDFTTWRLLAQSCEHWLAQKDVAAIVITHGTDTLEETAWFLQCVLQPSKPVVLTCAMRPATALSADGPANLRDAVCCAARGAAGVWVVAAGEVHSAMLVRKVHPYRMHAFASGAVGPAGWVEEGMVRWHADAVRSAVGGGLTLSAAQLPEISKWPWVEIITSCAGARGAVVDVLVAAGVRGLVVAATGNGSVHHELQAALARARSAGVVVRRSTRCEQGQIVQEAGGQDAAVSALSPVKARISLMLELMAGG